MKTPGLRSDEYRRFVSSLPCCLCDAAGVLDPWAYQDGMRRSDPDHLPLLGMKGIGIKSPDYFCVPLCRRHHDLRGQHLRRPHIRLLTIDDCDLRGCDPRLANWNPYETASRLLFAYFAQRPEELQVAI